MRASPFMGLACLSAVGGLGSDDASAIAKAYSMFAGRAFEAWQGAHKVYATKSPSISARTLGE